MALATAAGAGVGVRGTRATRVGEERLLGVVTRRCSPRPRSSCRGVARPHGSTGISRSSSRSRSVPRSVVVTRGRADLQRRT